MYLELHSSSAFSFLDGASLPETLVDRAADLGYPALALLDRDGVYGAPRFHKAAQAAGIKPILGCELSVSRDWGPGVGDWGSRGVKQNALAPTAQPLGPSPQSPAFFRLPVLVESRAGYRNLCRLVTRMKLRAPKGEGALTLADLEGSTAGLIALADRAVLSGSRDGVGGLLDRLVGLFGRSNVFVEIQRHLLRDEAHDNQALVALASAFHVPVVATNGVRFATMDARPLYDVLTCIRHQTTLDRAGRRLARNAERYLKPPEAMARLFEDLPEAIASTRVLADRLAYTMADLGYRFPTYPVPDGETEGSFLRKIAEVGARERYRPYHERARRQMARELDLIERLTLAGYFLIVWDIVNFCRQQDILVQGRGSAANSAVCYSLGITAVDPVGMDLLFERFLSEERGEWPDIDLDLPSGDRRERVIQHVYERYGQHGAGMTANVITYRGRSAAREVGKALGIEAGEIDRLAKVMHHFEWVDPDETLTRNLGDVGLDPDRPSIRLFADLWRRIQDLPRHLGQHSGGMVICQGRLDEVVPLENASMPGRVVVQWDKDDCADMGIVKVDLLGLGMMAVLQDALAMVNSHEPRTLLSARGAPPPLTAASHLHARQQPQALNHEPRTDDIHELSLAPSAQRLAPLDLASLPPDDPAVYRMLQQADTIGVFQVESRAQMATLPRLRPQRFYDLVVEVAIIRPGPIVGQMVHPYLRRRAGREPVVYPHPSLEPILARTLGVPLFQEQLLRVAMVAAGFSGGEAEELRRAFGFKRSVRRMKGIEVKLREGMEKRGIAGEAADQIVRSITSFALYGFPESHAASFALLVYASAYLKAHFPAAFYTALLNNQPMGFYHPATLVKDAQRRGVRFKPIEVDRSDWLCAVEPDGAIRLGLKYVTGLREDVGRAIEQAPAAAATAALSRCDARRRGASAFGGGAPNVLNEESASRGAAASGGGAPRALNNASPQICPKCGSDDPSMLEQVDDRRSFCNTCAHEWTNKGTNEPARFRSIEDLIARTAIRRDELATLAEIGALNRFGFDRRSALWQIERVVRPAGELFETAVDGFEGARGAPAAAATSESASRGAAASGGRAPRALNNALGAGDGGRVFRLREASARPAVALTEAVRSDGQPALNPEPETRTLLSARGAPPPLAAASRLHARQQPQALNREPGTNSPLSPMTPVERVVADYAGTGLTIGPHPMAFRRSDLAMRGVLRARDLPGARNGRRVRVAGAVITRQRPGTAKGFVFLTVEDETGIANIIVRPDLFASERLTLIEAPFLLIEGVLQIQDGVTSVKAEHVEPLWRAGAPDVDSHDFR